MKNFVIALLVGIIAGAGGMWYFEQERDSARAVQDAERRASAATAQAKEALGEAASGMKSALGAKLEALQLRAQDVKEDLARSGRLVRRTAREVGETVADATISAQIEAKLAADPVLEATRIDVDTNGGRVTLSGTAPSVEAVGLATLLALQTPGVREVVATLQVQEKPV